MIPPIKYYSNHFGQNFSNPYLLGEGGFGSVYSATCKLDECKYAIKKIPLSTKILQSDKFQAATAELRILAKLRHRNVVGYNTAWFEEEEKTDDKENSGSSSGSGHSRTSQGSLSDIANVSSESSPSQNSQIKFRDVVYIQMELCHHNLRDFLNRRNKDRVTLSSEDRKTMCNMTKQLLTGIDYIKSEEIVHRDIKPENIFIKGSDIKIGDFGLAKSLQLDRENGQPAQKMSGDVGTPIYMAPEVFGKDVNYDHKCDLYSVGVILLELMMIFKTTSGLWHTLTDIKEGRSNDFTAKWSIEAHFVVNLMNTDVKLRPSAKSILNDPFAFKEFVNEESEILNKIIAEESKKFAEAKMRFDDEKMRLVAEINRLTDENASLRMEIQQ